MSRDTTARVRSGLGEPFLACFLGDAEHDLGKDAAVLCLASGPVVTLVQLALAQHRREVRRAAVHLNEPAVLVVAGCQRHVQVRLQRFGVRVSRLDGAPTGRLRFDTNHLASACPDCSGYVDHDLRYRERVIEERC